MKNVISLALISYFGLTVNLTHAAAAANVVVNNANNAQLQQTKKVCHDQKDNKGKTVQVCKEVKVHKKLDGTKVPPK